MNRRQLRTQESFRGRGSRYIKVYQPATRDARWRRVMGINRRLGLGHLPAQNLGRGRDILARGDPTHAKEPDGGAWC
jgi:hypothetical protein